MEGTTPGEKPEQAAAEVRRWAEAGATWWIEAMWEASRKENDLETARRRLRQGPPR